MPWRTRSFRSLEILLAPPPWTTTTMGFMAKDLGVEDENVLSRRVQENRMGLTSPAGDKSSFHLNGGSFYGFRRIPETQGVRRAEV